ncbi:MAG: hypothetical protein F4Y08_12180 [Caldilineaceae bacterium SB0662_bin_9]|uniref:Uncharacterized protein n=1 Tax=Caldilineaceae bacterium SB0662_bin_9 TaxID=2605258 RepID=A0A6B1DWQ0_9CHLR|nr:hypothetical protein [Caldilineaceae bacterium SB0662_bin_9]
MPLVGLALATIALAVVVWSGHPASVRAQDGELSLRSLSDRLESLTQRVDALEGNRVSGLTGDERCGLAVFRTLRDETVLDYKNTYDEWPQMDRVWIRFVEFDPESESIVVFYEDYIEDRWVTESWEDCTFLEASEWWEE